MLEDLNKHLPLELSAHTRYNGHALLLKYKGYTKLAARYEEAAAEELGHANKIMWRIRQLDGMPNYLPTLVSKPMTKCDVVAMLKSDLVVEQSVLDSLTALAEEAEESQKDFETYRMTLELIEATEEDITWYSQQLELIEELGLNNYLQAQL
jgi:bacterioferritin